MRRDIFVCVPSESAAGVDNRVDLLVFFVEVGLDVPVGVEHLAGAVRDLLLLRIAASLFELGKPGHLIDAGSVGGESQRDRRPRDAESLASVGGDQDIEARVDVLGGISVLRLVLLGVGVEIDREAVDVGAQVGELDDVEVGLLGAVGEFVDVVPALFFVYGGRVPVGNGFRVPEDPRGIVGGYHAVGQLDLRHSEFTAGARFEVSDLHVEYVGFGADIGAESLSRRRERQREREDHHRGQHRGERQDAVFHFLFHRNLSLYFFSFLSASPVQGSSPRMDSTDTVMALL